MVKKVKKSKKEEGAGEPKEDNIEEAKAVEPENVEENEIYESDLVKLKKEN